ncbi:hypothetical protein FRB93_007642 [Tulasnella sp. JGI-2019a]|nr:hypothetical protein FRB93_007642 [Tulasnella sp. JGI-2019a]
MLRILWLEDYNFDAPIAIDFFRGVAPHLRELFLHHISLKNWGSPFLFNLRELSLIDVTGPTIEQLLAILEACSYLETLRLTLVYIDDNTSGHKPRHTINLLSLHQLAIARLSPAAGNCLLRTIQAPSCRDFLIKPIRDQNPTDIAICSECVNISFRSFLTTAKELSVTISTESFDRIRVTVMEQNNHCPFNVRLNGFSPSSIWSTSVPLLFPETSPAEIELDFRGGSPCVLLDTSAWILPGIRKIILGWEGEKAIERLTFAKMVDGEFRWLWPRLCDMVVDIVSGEKVLQMLVARAGAAMVKRASDNQQIFGVLLLKW